MNRNITRGLALAALTGGFSIFGATAANAIDLPDLGGGLVGGIIDDLTVPLTAEVPVIVDGLSVDVLSTSGGGLLGGDLLGTGDASLLGEGILVDTGNASADVLAELGVDTSQLLGESDVLHTIVGIPLDVSNTWVSILGNEPNGIVVVPTLSTEPSAVLDGLLDAAIGVPVDVTCTSVTVLSSYTNECSGSTPGGTGGGSPSEDGLLDGVIEAPIDLSNTWVSVLGDHPNGIVIVPDLTVDLSVLTGGLISSEILAPISLECVTITVLSDYERDCGTSTIDDTPTDPEVPEEPGTPIVTPVPGGDNGAENNGGNDDTAGITDPCMVEPTSAITTLNDEPTGANLGMLGLAALVGGLVALGFMLIGRKLGAQK